MALRIEYQEFVAKWKAASADGKVTLDEAGAIAVEAMDLVAPFWDALDPADSAAVASLQSDLLTMANEIIDNLPDGRFLPRTAAKAGASFAIPWLVESAAKAGAPFRSTVLSYVGPKTRAAETALHKFNVAIGA